MFNTWTFAVALLVAWLFREIIRIRRKRQEDKAFATQYACLPVETVLPCRWPLGLDLLKQQYDAARDQRLLAFQAPYLRKMPMMKVHMLGGVGYFTTDPRIIATILSGRSRDWGLGTRTNSLYPILGEGIFTQEDSAWKRSREIIRRQLALINIKDLRMFDSSVDEMLLRLRAAEDVVDLQKVFLQYTFATTMDLIFGTSVNDAQMWDRTLNDSLDYAQSIAAVRIRLGDLYWMCSPRSFRAATARVRAFMTNRVDEALGDAHDEHSGSRSVSLIRGLHAGLKDRELVRDQAIHLLTAGRDATALTMSWAIFLLLRHPGCLGRLRAEIAYVVKENEQLTRSHLLRMKYMRNVMKETLRLYPQLPANLRYAKRRTWLPTGGGPDGHAPVFVPKGGVVGYSVYHMHRRVDLYGPDAESFRPERWEEGDMETRIGWGYVAFHGGPRVCLGKEFALLEASYGIVAVLRAYPRLRLPPNIDTQPTGLERQTLGMFVASADGCKVSIK